jgi:clan AA aspartic protease
LAKILGSVDQLGRPVVRVAIVGRADEVLATIDTGFNGEAMMPLGDALQLGVTVLEGTRDVELGHGHSVAVQVGRMRVQWLGYERDVGVLISDRVTQTLSGPVMLIGTRLLKSHLLLIDFERGTVQIGTQH